MARYFTKTEARSAASGRRQRLAKSSGQILAEDRSRFSASDKFDIFLSHSFSDAELILGIKVILERLGFSVYVDWETDADLERSSVSKETAALLRARLGQSMSLLYVATDGASKSKWMPWELGYFDGLRKGGVAILPLLDQETAEFSGQEYLGLYPVVTKDFYTGGSKEQIFVEDYGIGWTTLDKFAKGNLSWIKYS